MNNSELYKNYIERGCRLILLERNGKRPLVKNWSSETVVVDDFDLELHDGNLGWALGSCDAVIDVDPRNGGTESYKRLAADLGLEHLKPSVATAGGGYHYYLTIPSEYEGSKFSRKLHGYEGVDFLTKGAFVVIAGSVIDGKSYRLRTGQFTCAALPQSLIDVALKSDVAAFESSDLGDFEGLIPVSDSNVDESKVDEMLLAIDPDLDHDDWVHVGMALHDWHPVAGLAKWIAWSSKGAKFTEGLCEKKWRSFSGGGGVTLGTLFHLYAGAEFDRGRVEVDALIRKIKFADVRTIQLSIAPKVSKMDLSIIDRDRIALSVKERIKEVDGVTIDIRNVRKMISPMTVAGGASGTVERMSHDKPEWCNDWVYSTHFGCFIRKSDRAMMKTEAFNIVNGNYVPMNDTGRKQPAASFVAENGFMEQVHAFAYAPMQGDSDIVYYDGHRCLNSFDPKSVPKAATEFTEGGLKAIEVFKRHVMLLCNQNTEYSEYLIKWLAHNVQFKGEKLLWSPVIQSIQGVGKSYLGSLLARCIGDRNVGTVNSDQVKSPFNSWAVDVCVNVLEELRVQGHNRHDVVNALKPLITDKRIQVNTKGLKQYVTVNTCNYICFTNFRDALPMTHSDRRWFVIFNDLETLDDIQNRVGISQKQYFQELFNSLNDHGDELAKYLLEYKIDKEFKAMQQAPATVYKQMMIDNDNMSDGLSELKELILSGEVEHVSRRILSSNHLFEAFEVEFPDIVLNNLEKNRLLKRLGFTKSSLRKKILGRKCGIWSTVPITEKLLLELRTL